MAANGQADIADVATNDLLSFGVVTNAGAQLDGQIAMWGTPTTGGVDCVFWGNARAG